MWNNLAYLSIVLYAAAFCCYARILYVPHAWLGRIATFVLSAGILAHYFALLNRSHVMHAIPYDDLYGSMSLFGWLLAVTYLGLEFLHRDRAVGAFVTSFLVLWLTGLVLLGHHEMPEPPPAGGPLFALHVTLNSWAYAAFALSFLLSIVYLAQDAVLRSRRPGAPFWRFPALDVLDRMARSSVYIGLIALIVGVSLGFVWQHRLTGKLLFGDPKVLVTLAILAAYIVYLWLSYISGWRGARAARVCALNFAVVLFSYTLVNLYLTRFHRFF